MVTALLLVLVFCVSCHTAIHLPTADFAAPGWRVQQGQAIWKPANNQPDFAGDMLLATNASGDYFVQFTKNPFPLVTAESVGGQWQIEFGVHEHFLSGRGEPPARFVWFQLPPAMLDEKIHRNWNFQTVTTNSWRLENKQTGETLEGGFFP
jgi:hypothetical protein